MVTRCACAPSSPPSTASSTPSARAVPRHRCWWSPLLCPVQEDTPGPLAPDFDGGTLRFKATGDPAERAAGRLTLNVIRDALAAVVEQRAADDPNLHHLDGRDLYGESDHAELPLPDAVHPCPEGHRRIAENFARLAFTGDGPFAATTG